MGREIRIGYEPDFPPLTYADDGTARGLIIDLLRAVFERLGTVPVFIPVVLAQHEAAVSRGDVDAISYKATVAGREDVWSFSEPILTTGIAWFAPPEGQPLPFARVATPAKGPLAGLLGSLFPGIEVTAVDSYDAALCAVIDRSVDAAALNYHVGADLARRH